MHRDKSTKPVGRIQALKHAFGSSSPAPPAADTGHSSSTQQPASNGTATDGTVQTLVKELKVQMKDAEGRCEEINKMSEKVLASIAKSGGVRDGMIVKDLQDGLNKLQKKSDQLRAEGRQLAEKFPDTMTTVANLKDAEDYVKQLEKESTELKKEVEDLKLEMDEVRDRVREEELREFSELQKELDLAAKNCRILQFKLRKSERRGELADGERHKMEGRVRQLQRQASGEDQQYLKELEEELRVAKEVSVRLHDELELAEERRARYDLENQSLNDILRQTESERRNMEKEVDNMRFQLERIRNKTGVPTRDAYAQSTETGAQGRIDTPAETRSATAKNRQLLRSSTEEGPRRQNSLDSEYVELRRDLTDALEREQDTRDQLQQAEEQLRSFRAKLTDMEEENESLVHQVKRLVKGDNAGQRSRGGTVGSGAQLQLELSEQEVRILRRKLESAERNNETMAQEVAVLQEKLHKQREGGPALGKPTLGSRRMSSRASADERLAEAERESDELRNLLDEKERQITSLLDEGATDANMKRQVELLRQETLLLREKITRLETERAGLAELNNRLHAQLSRSTESMESVESSSRLDSFDTDNSSLKGKLRILEEERMKEQLVASERVIALEKELSETRVKLSFLAAENTNLLQEVENVRTKKPSQPDVTANTTKEDLMKKVTALQLQVDNLLTNVAQRQARCETLEAMVQHIERGPTERESELQGDVVTLKRNNSVLSNLLDMMTERAEITQTTLDKYLQILSAPPDLISGSSDDQMKLKLKVMTLEEDLVKAKTIGSSQATEQVQAYEKQVKEAEKRLKLLELTNRTLNTELDTLKKKGEGEKSKSFEAARAAADKQLVEHKAKVLKLESEVVKLTEQLGENKQLREQVKTLQAEMKSTKTRSEQIEGKYKELSKEHQNKDLESRAKREQAESANKKLREELLTKEKEAKVLEKSLQDTKKELAVKEDMIQAKEKELKAKDDGVSKKESLMKAQGNEIKSLREERKTLQLQISAHEEHVVKAEREVKRIEDALRAQDDKMKDKDSVMNTLNNKVAEKERALKFREKEINSLFVKLKEASDRLEERDREVKKLKSQMPESAPTESQLLKLKKKLKNMQSSSSTSEKEVVKSLQTAQENMETEKTRLQEEVAKLRTELNSLNENWKLEREELLKIIEEKNQLISDNGAIASRLDAEMEKMRKLVNWDTTNTDPSTLERLKREMAAAITRAAYEGEIHEKDVRLQSLLNSVGRLEFETHSQRLLLELAQKRLEEVQAGFTTSKELWAEERTGYRGKIEELDTVKKENKRLQENVENLDSKLRVRDRLDSRVEADHDAEKCQLELKLSSLQSQLNKAEEAAGGLLTNKWRHMARGEIRWERERTDNAKVMDNSKKVISELRKKLEEAQDQNEADKVRLKEKFEKERSGFTKDNEENKRQLKELKDKSRQLSAVCRQLDVLQTEMRRERQRVARERTSSEKRHEECRLISHFLAEQMDSVQVATEKLKVILGVFEPDSKSKSTSPADRDYIATNLREVVETMGAAVSRCKEKTKLDVMQRSHSLDRALPEEEEDLLAGEHFLGVSSSTAGRLPKTSYSASTSASCTTTPELSRSISAAARAETPRRISNYPTAPPSFLLRASDASLNYDSETESLRDARYTRQATRKQFYDTYSSRHDDYKRSNQSLASNTSFGSELSGRQSTDSVPAISIYSTDGERRSTYGQKKSVSFDQCSVSSFGSGVSGLSGASGASAYSSYSYGRYASGRYTGASSSVGTTDYKEMGRLHVPSRRRLQFNSNFETQL